MDDKEVYPKLRNRKEEIKSKGFDVAGTTIIPDDLAPAAQHIPLDFNKIKVGTKQLEDAIYDLGTYNKINSAAGNKNNVLRAIDSYDLKSMRNISDFFYKTSGIYSRIIRYMSFIYRYDWFVTPYIIDQNLPEDKILKSFNNALNLLDDFKVKKVLGDITLYILRYGVYYGYILENGNNFDLQELPPEYCRSRFSKGKRPVVEFNMKYFDTFRNEEQRNRILKIFPAEFSKGYNLYKAGKLPPQDTGDTSGWYMLDPKYSVKFNINGEDYPAFIAIIPLILDLDEAQELDRRRTLQRLLKIVIQKMPLDKNGELVFDVEEAQQLHNSAVQMLGKAIGVDVLTTFADVEVASMSNNNAATAQADDLIRVERQVFNESGVSTGLFNTEGNLALEKSILNDEASMSNLLLQYEMFLDSLLELAGLNSKKIKFRVQILTTTIYNYKEMSKLYKEQMAIGFSKMLPQLALGQSQSSILANAHFENNILHLIEVFIPPLQSSVMNGDTLAQVRGGSEEKTAGRKELPDDQKSEKTIMNKEAMG